VSPFRFRLWRFGLTHHENTTPDERFWRQVVGRLWWRKIT